MSALNVSAPWGKADILDRLAYVGKMTQPD
jgi:hypothetical protein